MNQKQPNLLRQHPILNPKRIDALYNQTGDEFLWSPEWEPFRKAFLQTLERADDFGLDRNNYHYTLLKTLSRKNPLAYELYTSDALLTFMEHVGYGTDRPNWLTINPDCDPVGQEFGVETYLLSAFANCYTFPQVLEGTEPQTQVYQTLRSELVRVNSIAGKTELTTGLVPFSDALADNTLLIHRLKAWGVVPLKAANLSEEQARQALKVFQQKVGEPTDGRLTVATLAKVNKPIAQYRKMLTSSLNSWRWLNAINEYKTLVINLPAAELYGFEGCTVALSMRTLLGKPETPTPQFLAQLTSVAFSPNSGHSGFLPYNIPPSELTLFAQDLSLQAGFRQDNRFRNLGGVQIEKPVALAAWLLEDKDEVNHLIQSPPSQTGSKPVIRKISPPVSLLVFTNPIGIDAQGHIRLYDPVYQQVSFSLMRK
ncbi:hypothetical protein GCM10023189_19550 [Nibrella saemangeumensis]|uniref:L,D-transpeptidase scaffold domain-containing protein n=1 Tax=Nibrella saemangeumensis TaxID=1084526 RepID=A0ABP8MSR2_9BACT